MKNIKDFETKMIHNGNRNVKYALVKCSYCGEDKWEQWQRVKRQENFFCDRKHCNLWQKDQAKHVGKENARFNWDESNHRWIAQWWEESNGKRVLKNTTKAKWLWEQVHGEIPDGYWIMYGDDNSENCKTENLELISRGERMSDVMMGHKHSEEAKRNMSIAHTGKVLSSEHKKNISKSIVARWRRGEFDTKEYRNAAADRVRGENNPNWRGGATNNPYPAGWSRELKNKIRLRDDHKCQICFVSGKVVHHIDADKNNLDLDNLITVCKRCHHNIHSTRKTSNIVITAFRSMLKY